MRSRFDESSESGYAYYGGMLNAGYLTGFVRRVEGRKFMVQQINDLKLALPVEIEERGISMPQDTMPIKVVGRFIGNRLETGERVMRFRAITLDRPSIRELPNRLAWEKPLVNGEDTDSFKPFFDPHDDEQVSSPFYKGEKRNGRPCLNVARLAGFVESFVYKSSNDGRSDCMYIALRQTQDPNQCLPVRVYGRFTQSFKDRIQVALPIFIEGFYRVKRENIGTEDAPNWVTMPYIHCSNIKVATPADIKVRPEWWQEMKDRLIRVSKERLNASAANNKKQPKEQNPKPTPKKEPEQPVVEASAPASIEVDDTL